MTSPTSLGTYLKDRRARLDPVALGFPCARRRTPGLRREEVAQRANISPLGTLGLSRTEAEHLRLMCSIGSPKGYC